MASLIRGVISRALLLVLALLAAGSAYVIFVQLPTDMTFWKAGFTLIVLTITMTSALLSSLTLNTRYVILGVLGMAASLFSAVTIIFALWEGKIAKIPATPAEALNNYVGSASGSSIGTGMVIIIALVILALPLINVVLYFAYQSNPVGEILGLVTVGAIVGDIVIAGLATANQSWNEPTLKWAAFLGIIAVIGIVGTPVAASFDSGEVDRDTGRGIHYDIKPDDHSSSPTRPAQPRKVIPQATIPVHEEPQMPELDYRP